MVARRVAELAEGEEPAMALAGPLGGPLDLLGLWDQADLAIVADAVRTGAAPGTVTLDWLGQSGPTHLGPGTPRPGAPGLARPGLEPRSLGGLELVPSAADARPPSTHGLGLAEVYRLAGALGQAPHRVAVVGIEGHDFSHGEGLSEPVGQGANKAVALVLAVLRSGMQQASSQERLPSNSVMKALSNTSMTDASA